LKDKKTFRSIKKIRICRIVGIVENSVRTQLKELAEVLNGKTFLLVYTQWKRFKKKI